MGTDIEQPAYTRQKIQIAERAVAAAMDEINEHNPRNHRLLRLLQASLDNLDDADSETVDVYVTCAGCGHSICNLDGDADFCVDCEYANGDIDSEPAA